MEGYEYRKDKYDKLIYNISFINRCKPHYHRQIEMFYVIRGKQTVIINQNKLVAKKGDFVFCNPYDIHEFKNDSLHQICFISISNEYLSNFFKYTKSNRLKCNLLKKSDKTKKIYEIMQEFKNLDKSNFLYKQGVVDKLLGYITDVIGIENTNNANETNLISKIIEFIDGNYKENLTIEQIANYCNYSKFYISKIFNRTFNCNINQYINLRRIEEFVTLKNNNLELKNNELCITCGFNNTRTFYRAFYDVYECSPKEFFKNSTDKT